MRCWVLGLVHLRRVLGRLKSRAAEDLKVWDLKLRTCSFVLHSDGVPVYEKKVNLWVWFANDR